MFNCNFTVAFWQQQLLELYCKNNIFFFLVPSWFDSFFYHKIYKHFLQFNDIFISLHISLIQMITVHPFLAESVNNRTHFLLFLPGSHRVGKKWSIAFDMSSLSANDNVQLAELRIRQPAFTESSSVVDVYHSHKHRCPGCPDSRHLLGRLRARPSSTASSFSWKVFDMTEMLSGWLQRGHGGRRTELQEDEVEEDIQHATADRVVMVVFSSQNSQKTLIRVAERSKYVRTTSSSGARRGREKRHPRTENNGPLCRRTDMWVNFEKFGWADYIVFPKRYNAYQCQGSCPTPVNETFGPTNHAYMQSLLHHHHPDKVPCLSCVPTRLSPLSMLYYENGKMVMKHHEDMVVEECGCE
ncbi:nodal homolog 2-A-like [Acanthochromis polyacanthus]|uniref:nodal homolog 2-A-like n=1 Tax=Acanthochromis polyacanthus TaxID=80966 RepID=UPI0022342B3F|nr:nodal homolog 2-A-like [Acanthochromis polyacanthus]